MTKYFLVNNASRAAVYGIGTYIKQFADCIQYYRPQLELCFLDICSGVKEFTVDRDERGFSHYRIPPFMGRGNFFLYHRCILFLLEPYISEEDEVVFHFNYSLHFDLMRLIKARYKFSRVIYTIHYLNWCFTLNGNLSRFRKLINNEVKDDLKESVLRDFYDDKRLFSLCDEVIVLSKFTYELLRTDYKIEESKIHLVYNGMAENTQMLKYRIEDGLQQNILFVGRLDEIKGIEYIIKAFKNILIRRGNVRLTLVGDGNFSRYLTLCDGIWDKVTFTGKLTKVNLDQFYCRATIGVQPSFHEQCSYSAIEMMAHGIPFIATDSTGLSEMMDYTPECLIHIDEENFQPENFTKQLADKMEMLLSDSLLRSEVSKNLLRLFKKRYILNCMSNAWGNVLSSMRKKDYSISKDFFLYLDNEVICLINNRPTLDMDYVGLTGIGCYLWWRIEALRIQDDRAHVFNLVKLQEYMIYYIDWLFDVLEADGIGAFSSCFDPVPLNWMLSSLAKAGFYITKVDKFIHKISSLGIDMTTADFKNLEISGIVRNTLKIYNLNLKI